MTETTIEPKRAFRHLNEAEILAALESYENNPIAREVQRLMEGYSGHLQRLLDQLGYIPSYAFDIKPRWPIERVAIRRMSETIAQEPKRE